MRPDNLTAELYAALVRSLTSGHDASVRADRAIVIGSNVLTVGPDSTPDRAVVTMTFHHPEDVDAPTRFRISPCDPDDTLVRVNDGDPDTIEAVAADLAHVFARQAMRR